MFPTRYAWNNTTQVYDGNVCACRLFEEPWWTGHLSQEQISYWLAVIQPRQLAGFELRVKQGVLHALSDLLQHLGHNMQPFLPEISVLLLALLETTKVRNSPIPY